MASRCTALLVCLVASATRAEDSPADEFLAAVRANEQHRQQEISRDATRPWITADRLIRRGERRAALLFARTCLRHHPFRKDVEKLVAYVESFREREANTVYARLDSIATLAPEKALAALSKLDSDSAKDPVLAALVLRFRGRLFKRLRRFQESVSCTVLAGRVASKLGWRRKHAESLFVAARDCVLIADFERARSLCAESLAIHTERGDEAGRLRSLTQLANVLPVDRDGEAARVAGEAVALACKLGNRAQEAHALSALARASSDRGSARVEALYRQALRIHETLKGNRDNMATACGLLGRLLRDNGRYREALPYLERARQASGRTGGFPALDVQCLADMADCHGALGNKAGALKFYEQSLRVAVAIRSRPGIARAEMGIGGTLTKLGDLEGAEPHLRRALDVYRELKGPKVGPVHSSLADLEIRRRRFEAALKHVGAARRAGESSGDTRTVARSHMLEGHIQWLNKEDSSAIRSYRKALHLLEESRKFPVMMGKLLCVLAGARQLMGECDDALPLAYKARRIARETGSSSCEVNALWVLSRAHLGRKDTEKALRAVRQAIDIRYGCGSGLSDRHAVMRRTQDRRLLTRGAYLSLVRDDLESSWFFAEMARAGAFLEILAARPAMRSAVLPVGLRALDRQARVAEADAMHAMRAMLEAGDVERVKLARERLVAVRKRRAAVDDRIEREAKSANGLYQPSVRPLRDVQALLRAGEALVAYLRGGQEMCAIVLTQHDARTVELAKYREINRFCRTLRLDSALFDSGAAIERLRAMATAPLGLGKNVHRVLVSPTDDLLRVPLALLFPGREVAAIPSGTVYATLMAEPTQQGRGILALGDPDYGRTAKKAMITAGRGAWLRSLPGTGDEARSVGTRTLLGPRATEAGLRKYAVSRHWRAIHLACHGLIDAERPLFSSLALTQQGEDDGLLGVPDVFRMRVDTDLVVLSACRTGRGKIVSAEGVLGFTRAFMFAGAPRVIVSLWKVNDEATKTLMEKFYELWNPKDGSKGLPTAMALKKAQEHVRDLKEEWKHPYYWAAWQLWGRGD